MIDTRRPPVSLSKSLAEIQTRCIVSVETPHRSARSHQSASAMNSRSGIVTSFDGTVQNSPTGYREPPRGHSADLSERNVYQCDRLHRARTKRRSGAAENEPIDALRLLVASSDLR